MTKKAKKNFAGGKKPENKTTDETRDLVTARLAGIAHSYRIAAGAMESFNEIALSYTKRILESSDLFQRCLVGGGLTSQAVHSHASVHEYMALLLRNFGKSKAISGFAYTTLREEYKDAQEVLGKVTTQKILLDEWDDNLPPEIKALLS